MRSWSLKAASFPAFSSSWTPKVCKIMAFMAIMRGLGLSFCIHLGFRLGVLDWARPSPCTSVATDKDPDAAASIPCGGHQVGA